MRANRLVIPVFAAVALSSCTDAAPTPVVEGSVRELSAFMVGSRIQPSSAERAAVDSLVQLFPSPSAAQIRAILSDPRAKLDLTGNAEVRRRLDAVYEARAARAREISGGVEDATLALVTVLPDAAADAVILRRADAIPHDVILFRADQLSAARLASAIDALYRARRH